MRTKLRGRPERFSTSVSREKHEVMNFSVGDYGIDDIVDVIEKFSALTDIILVAEEGMDLWTKGSPKREFKGPGRTY
jgi:hypothetical protein